MISRTFTIPVLSILALLGVANVNGQKTKPLDAIYDPSKNETTVYLLRPSIAVATYPSEDFVPPRTGEYSTKREGLRMVVYFKCAGNKPSIPELVVVKFDSTASGGYRFNQNVNFTVTADSQRLDMGTMQLTQNRDSASRGIGGFYFQETLEKAVKLEDYERIVAAKKVEMTVGETRFRLSEKDIETMRRYLERLRS